MFSEGFIFGYFFGVSVTFIAGWFGLKVFGFRLRVERKS
jgi:hypothetical protein